ncbi:MAG: hypothetical protein FJZ58_05570, partial [Chlamydiae bacterium]|nr:hypothetical protein [Chlamydiota bacterium]
MNCICCSLQNVTEYFQAFGSACSSLLLWNVGRTWQGFFSDWGEFCNKMAQGESYSPRPVPAPQEGILSEQTFQSDIQSGRLDVLYYWSTLPHDNDIAEPSSWERFFGGREEEFCQALFPKNNDSPTQPASNITPPHESTSHALVTGTSGQVISSSIISGQTVVALSNPVTQEKHLLSLQIPVEPRLSISTEFLSSYAHFRIEGLWLARRVPTSIYQGHHYEPLALLASTPQTHSIREEEYENIHASDASLTSNIVDSAVGSLFGLVRTVLPSPSFRDSLLEEMSKNLHNKASFSSSPPEASNQS